MTGQHTEDDLDRIRDDGWRWPAPLPWYRATDDDRTTELRRWVVRPDDDEEE